MTQLISPIGQVYDIPILTYSATSAYLSSKDDYPQIWRSVAPDSVRVIAWINLCEYYQWANIIVLVEASLYSQGAAEYFQLLGAEAGLTITAITFDSANQIPAALKKVRDSGVKIVFAPVITYLIPLVQEAVRTKMVGSDSFVARQEDQTVVYDTHWDPFDTTLMPNTSMPNMQMTSTLLKKNVRAGDPRVQGYVWIWGDSASVSDSTYSKVWPGSFTATEPSQDVAQEFNTTQLASLYASSTAKLKSVYDSINTSSIFRKGRDSDRASFTVAVSDPYSFFPTSIARAFLAVCDIAKTNYEAYGVLPDAANMTRSLSTFKSKILGAEFFFDSNQEFPNSPMLVLNPKQSKWMNTIANWAKDTNFVWNSKETKAIFGDGSVHIPDDGIALETYIFTSRPLGISIITMCLLVMTIIALTGFAVFKYWSTPVIRLASPHQLVVILVGLFFLCLGLIFYVGRPSRAICVLRIWPYYMGMSMIFSPVITKTFRVWMVFRGANQLKKMVITNRRLGIYTAILNIPTLLLSVMRTILDNTSDTRTLFPPLYWGITSNAVGYSAEYGQQRVDVICAIPSPVWSYVQIGYLGAQMLAALFLAWKTRNVPTGFNESRYVFISVYVRVLPLAFSNALCNHFLIGETDFAFSDMFDAFWNLHEFDLVIDHFNHRYHRSYYFKRPCCDQPYAFFRNSSLLVAHLLGGDLGASFHPQALYCASQA